MGNQRRLVPFAQESIARPENERCFLVFRTPQRPMPRQVDNGYPIKWSCDLEETRITSDLLDRYRFIVDNGDRYLPKRTASILIISDRPDSIAKCLPRAHVVTTNPKEASNYSLVIVDSSYLESLAEINLNLSVVIAIAPATSPPLSAHYVCPPDGIEELLPPLLQWRAIPSNCSIERWSSKNFIE